MFIEVFINSDKFSIPVENFAFDNKRASLLAAQTEKNEMQTLNDMQSTIAWSDHGLPESYIKDLKTTHTIMYFRHNNESYYFSGYLKSPGNPLVWEGVL